MGGPAYWLQVVALDVAAMVAVQVGAGYAAHRLPARLLDADGWLFRQRRFERDGRLYVEAFRIRRWKGRLPEAGDVFPGGFDKARLLRADDAYLARYVRETRRAEAAHWMGLAAAPAFVLWNPWYAAALVQAYALAANGPCILSQRYNRIRLERVLRRRAEAAPS